MVREDVEHRPEVDPARPRSCHAEQPEHVRRGRELREEEVLDRGVRVVAEPVGVLDLLEHLAVEPVVRLPGPTLDLGVDAEPHVVALAFSRSATGRRRRGRENSRPPVMPLGRRMSTIVIRAPSTISAVPAGTVRCHPNTLDGVHRGREEGVDAVHGERADDRAEQASGASDDEHRQRDERQIEIQVVRRERLQVDVEAAGEAREPAREREREQPLPVDRDPGRRCRRRILTGRTQHPAEARALVGVGHGYADQGADRRLPDPGRRGNRGEVVQGRADETLVIEHVVRDLEHGERRDTGGEAREPHQRQPDRERERATDGGSKRERRDVADIRLQQEVGQARHDLQLLTLRHREHARRPGADCDEADLPERDDTRVADEHVEPHDDRDLDERVDEIRLEIARDLERQQRSRQNQQGRHQHLGQPRTRFIRAPPSRRRG